MSLGYEPSVNRFTLPHQLIDYNADNQHCVRSQRTLTTWPKLPTPGKIYPSNLIFGVFNNLTL